MTMRVQMPDDDDPRVVSPDDLARFRQQRAAREDTAQSKVEPRPRYEQPEQQRQRNSQSSVRSQPLPGNTQARPERLINRAMIARKRGLMAGVLGVAFELNSAYTSIVICAGIWGIMFQAPGWGGVFGAVVAVSLFLGQIFTSDYEVPILDEKGSPILDAQKKPTFETMPNLKRAYFFWLTPDVLMTGIFWVAPFFRLTTSILAGSPAPVWSIQDIQVLWLVMWEHSWIAFIAYLLCLIIAIALSSFLGTWSAAYPEKVLLGPREREVIKDHVRRGWARAQEALRV